MTDDNACESGGGVAAEIDTIGREFAFGYYRAAAAAAAATTDTDTTTATATAANPLHRFYDDKSKYVFLRRGRRPDLKARGADQIGRLTARMADCTLDVQSVDAIRVKPDWFAVLTVCTVRRARTDGEADDDDRDGERPTSRTFIQSTVVKYAPSSSADRRFVVVGTVSMFDDRLDDDVFWPPPLPTVDELETTLTVAERNAGEQDASPETVDGADETRTTERTSSAVTVAETGADALTDESTKVPAENRIGDDKRQIADGAKSSADDSNGIEHIEDKTPLRPAVTAIKSGVPKESADGEKPSELYVGGLSKTVDADQLNATFGRYGALISADILEGIKKKGRLERRRYGVVQFERPEIVDLVAGLGNVTLENGENVIVEKLKKPRKTSR